MPVPSLTFTSCPSTINMLQTFTCSIKIQTFDSFVSIAFDYGDGVLIYYSNNLTGILCNHKQSI